MMKSLLELVFGHGPAVRPVPIAVPVSHTPPAEAEEAKERAERLLNCFPKCC